MPRRFGWRYPGRLPGNYGMRQVSSIFFVLLWLTGCATSPPSQTADICSIFREKDDWYASARRAYRHWGTPIPLQMAIINQESSFVDDAQPDRVRFLGIPLWRPSSAFGYAQAKDETWDWYEQRTGNGGADRDDFADAADFVAWYVHQTSSRLGVRKSDAYNQYLAYHEGQTGFLRGAWRRKPALQRIARRVQSMAWRYAEQLNRCRAELDLAASD